MNGKNYDVIVLGAGAAGLAAAMRLSASQKRVLILEARERIGGRILTVSDGSYAVELGAEFVHGRASEIFELVERFGLELTEVDGDMVCSTGGQLRECDFFEQVDKVFGDLKTYKGPDISFEEFLGREPRKETTKQWARGYVEGFHAAPADEAGILGILDDTRAEEKIDGERSWRIAGGYQRLVEKMWDACQQQGVELQLGTPVREVRWHERVEIAAGENTFRASHAVITLPLPVLQAGNVSFEPALDSKREALSGLAMGKVARCTLVFRSCWWKRLKSGNGEPLEKLSFLFSRERDFPTWWTQAPSDTPVLTAWASAIGAPQLAGLSREEVARRAIAALDRITGAGEKTIRAELLNVDYHDWTTDPWSGGAYSFARVGGRSAYRKLAEPVGGLFFAGEATEFTGNHATVHGAIASGYRAADEVLAASRR